MILKVQIAALMLVAMMLAGCIGGEDEPELDDQDDQIGPTETTGVVHGEVKGLWNLAPLQATIRIADNQEVVSENTTDDQGRYILPNLDPGIYRLIVTAACCENHVENVEVVAGLETEVNVLLEQVRRQAAYVERDQWTGFIACTATTYAGGTPWTGSNPTEVIGETCDDIDPQSDRTHTFTVDEGIRTIVFAMVWDGELTTTSCFFVGVTGVYIDLSNETVDVEPSELGVYPLHFLRVSLVHEESNVRYTTLDGPSPLNTTIGPYAGAVDVQLSNISQETQLEFKVSGSSGFCGASYQQQFTIYYDLYYWNEAPEGASALPDL